MHTPHPLCWIILTLYIVWLLTILFRLDTVKELDRELIWFEAGAWLLIPITGYAIGKSIESILKHFASAI